jgi:hypothetical protein
VGLKPRYSNASESLVALIDKSEGTE